VVPSKLCVDRLAEDRAQVDGRQLEGPAAERMTVMIDGKDVLPARE
jgi:hypothetical protein